MIFCHQRRLQRTIFHKDNFRFKSIEKLVSKSNACLLGVLTAVNDYNLLRNFVVKDSHLVLEVKINSELVVREINLIESAGLLGYLFTLHVSEEIKMLPVYADYVHVLKYLTEGLLVIHGEDVAMFEDVGVEGLDQIRVVLLVIRICAQSYP